MTTEAPSTVSLFFDRWFPTPKFILPHAAGIDISDSSIKWITLEGEKGSLRITSWGNQPLPPGIVVGGAVQNIEALTHALEEIKPHVLASAAHAALPEEAAYVFGMQAPRGSNRKAILGMIEFELDGRVPIPPAAAVYDFNVVEETTEGIEIGVSVFPKEIAEHYAAAFEDAGIELLSLETEARSVARSVSSSEKNEPITLIVDFGRARTGFAVVKHGAPIFTSTVEVGGNSVIASLQRMFGMSPEDAQHYANYEGLISGSGPRSGLEAILPTASALADEIERHFHYWDTRRNEKGERVTPVGRIALLGGSSNMRGLPEYISGRVHAPVDLGNIWRHVCNFDDYIPSIDRKTSLQFGTAVGLALRTL